MDVGNNFDVETNPPSLHSSTPSTDAGSSTLGQQQTEAALLFVATIMCLIFVIICSWRQYFKNCSAASCSCCTKQFPRDSREIQNLEQFYEDRTLAYSLQSRMNEEERERERLVKRKERRMWYEYYIKPWTVVVEKSDLFHANPKDSALEKEGHSHRENDDGKIMVETGMQKTSKDGNEALLDSDIEEISYDAEMQRASQFNICHEIDEDSTLYLKLPESDRCIDGTCAFCLDEYEVGDKVVWSDLQCSHVFHEECLMQWFSKGKKRCPVCRHWFVPGAKIDDQKRLHGEAWQNALSEMEQRKKEENEKQTTKIEKQTESVVDLEQGKVEITNMLQSSQSITTLITSESHNQQHTKPGYDELICTLSCNDSGDSEHSFDNIVARSC